MHTSPNINEDILYGEVSAKMSMSHRERKSLKETKRKISDALKGRKCSDEHKKRISDAKSAAIKNTLRRNE